MALVDLRFHRAWIEQCAAAREIKERYGTKNALDYLVREKLMNFVEAAEKRPDFARELPEFLNAIRSIFSREEISSCLDGLESEPTVVDDEFSEDDDENVGSLLGDPVREAERILRFARVKAMLQT